MLEILLTVKRMKINTEISKIEFVPPELWGRDHFSTLAYIENQLVDNEYCVAFDPHMRQNRTNYRTLGELAGAKVKYGVVMSPEHGSILSDGTYLSWHDDWCCVQDMLHYKLFDGEDDDFDIGFSLKLTELGYNVVANLRKHKAEGGTFSTFKMELP